MLDSLEIACWRIMASGRCKTRRQQKGVAGAIALTPAMLPGGEKGNLQKKQE